MAVVRRVREEKVRAEGRKQQAARRSQVRPKRDAFVKDLLADLSKTSNRGNVKKAEEIFAMLLSFEVGFTDGSRMINNVIPAATRGGDVGKAKQWFEDLLYVFFFSRMEPCSDVS